MTSTDPAEAPQAYPIAGMDRRFYGFVLDRLLVWTLYVVAAYAAYRWLIDPGQVWAGAGAIAGTVVLLGLIVSVMVGTAGVTPAKLLVGLRVVSVESGRPIGVLRAVLRTLVLGIAGLPTFGFGAAALAVTAVSDPTGRRRGWHDLRARSVVVDVRPMPVEAEVEEDAPMQVVNLTALRLVPASPNPPSHVPARRSRAVPKPLPPRLGPATPSDAPQAPTPRQGLGWPLVGVAPDEQDAAPATLRPATPGSGTATPDPAAAAPPPVHVEAPLPPAPPPAPSDSLGSPTAAAPDGRPPARWQVSFDTGEAFEVAGLTLVGRKPESRPGEPVKQLVTLASGDMSLSKTHAQFQVVPDGALVVMDRGSTNGSILIRAGMTRPLTGGKPQTLRDADRVRFGDREMTVARLAD